MFNIDRRVIYIIIAVMATITIGQYAQNPEQLVALLLTIPGVLIAITFHEFAHAIMAYKLGDDTPKNQGRISLNPLTHIDLVGFFMLIFAHIGWGKPVEINPVNFNRKRSMSAQEAIVALAGPAMNIIISLVLMIILFTINKFFGAFILTKAGVLIEIAIHMAIVVNIGLGVFNLIPLPPLDGSKILKHFLPYKAQNWLQQNQHIFYMIFIVMWVTPLMGYVISPVINVIYNGMYKLVSIIFSFF